MKHKFTLSLILSAAVLTAAGAPIDDARRMVDDGRYEEAAAALRKIVKSSPRNARANYLLGYSLMKTGAEAEGLKYLRTAEDRGSADAAAFLAHRSFDLYEPDEAQEHLDAWETAMRKARKSLPADYDKLTSRLVAMGNMLQRVEKIEIIDTLRVDSTAFFSHYRLSGHAGSLAPGNALGAGSTASVVFVPETRSEMFWAATDSAGRSAVFSSAILDDGTMENPEQAALTEDGNAAFPFLMPDGMTLYYAADEGPDGLGGYDIFMTRRNDDGTYMQSQNMGMPYNSPYNDFMLAIDETSGLGWWASDRERIPGKVTIYVYAPSETRVNYDPDAENLAELASLSDISLTRDADRDYKALMQEKLAKIESGSGAAETGTATFELDMGRKGIYTKLSDFRSDDARRAMLNVLAAEAELRKKADRLQTLRERYSSTRDRSLTHTILQLEKEVEKDREALRSARNAVVRMEER